MFIKDMQRFEDNRYKARAYMTYILTRNLPNKLPDIRLESIRAALDKIEHDISVFDALYILDTSGRQIGNAIALKKEYETGDGEDKSSKAYFYRAVNLKRCTLSDPYPSVLNSELCVTASMPIYDNKDNLLFVVCIDISLANILKMIETGYSETIFTYFSRIVYFCFAVVLFIITCFLFQKGLFSLFHPKGEVGIQVIFQSTIAITLALAIFDLTKTIIEEEVFGKTKKEINGIQKTMVRFLGSIIIALAIEALMLVFKLVSSDLSQMLYVFYLIGSINLLLIGLSIYLFAVKYKNN
ncbi:PDC sensor domain-containing protein [Campylobacter sp. LH-2024]|uniref:PDC sensor domain-containing protein n=1 Tax=Campylobacter TaxID=194 RepID=UPI0019047CA6|nr:PDC sensor domain-containing protein [Campylobacter sp. 2018MI35]MBZ7928880.1 hypothetical protein [Campylobacter sp. RM10542]MBZ7930427.1 hypothetical protein [Campylobacter sp. W0067]MBZ7931088.1 hypothetical protein [Campylobacter sp. RM12910]MBZ7932595.1 hypothetical protein [Campylobacter sp. RM10543]MBZ7934128.1 hypothetical protein [Campylobacter sp. W0065]MBZ7937887.1 hypothetical protein [Campylobacter sp. RM10538]MBZ7940559.1 hypothetical protein [Campylobacter sp. W0047]MBZ794